MLTATDVRTSKTAKIKKIILILHCTLSYVIVQRYSNGFRIPAISYQ